MRSLLPDRQGRTRTIVRDRLASANERSICRLRKVALQPMQTRGATVLQARRLRTGAVDAWLRDGEVDQHHHVVAGERLVQCYAGLRGDHFTP